MDSAHLNGSSHASQHPEVLAEPAVFSNTQQPPSESRHNTSQDDTPRKQHNLKPSLSSHVSFHDDDESEEDLGEARLDPAWGIKRPESTNLLQTVHRSPSFPMPPASSDEPEAVLSHSDPDAENQVPVEQELRPDEHTIGPVEETEAIQEERERFDQGLPLIQHEHPPEDPVRSHPVDEAPAATIPLDGLQMAADDESAGFFDQIDHTIVMPNPPAPERKGTEEVLRTLGVQDRQSDSPPPPLYDELLVRKQSSPKPKETENPFADLSQDENDPWQSILEDDEDGFLVEDADDLLPDSDDEPQLEVAPPRSQTNAQPPQQTSPYSRSNVNYAPHQPSTAEMSYFAGAAQGSLGLQKPAFSPFQQQNLRPNITERAASYVDQNKAGYKSPYDLPIDLAPKQKRRTQRPAPTIANLPPPPPRSSSIGGDNSLQSPFTPTTTGFGQFPTSMSTPASVQSPVDRAASVPVRASQPPNKRMSSGFFEELPITARVRPQPASRISAVQSPPGPPAPMNPNVINSRPPVQPQSPPQPRQQDPYAQYQLQSPQKLDPYSGLALPLPTPVDAAVVTNRYSPAPPTLQPGTRPSPTPRYSPAPPAVPGPRYSPAPPPQTGASQNRYTAQAAPPSTLPFLPRTSSPLAQHRKSVDGSAESAAKDISSRPQPHHLPSSSAPFASTLPPSSALSPSRTTEPIKQSALPPPRRSQTQSPSQQVPKSNYAPRHAAPPNRPQSAFGQMAPVRSVAQPHIVPSPAAMSLHPTNTMSNPAVPDSDFIRPQDEMQFDPLQRWKGSAIMHFGFGGNVVTSFPVHTPRFSAASVRPQIKVGPGEVRIKSIYDLYSLPDHVNKFPGPLKGKSKKKDVLTWLTSCITTLEEANAQTAGPDAVKRTHEKVMLWKIVRALVEHDGNLESPQALQSVNAILMPEIYTLDEATATQYRADEATSGIYRPTGMPTRNEPIDTSAIEGVRKTLLKGKREEAVWQAVDAHLWSHALLLASTVERQIWRQVVQEFVKREVKTAGANSEPLCAFYEVLGGNLEESIDQLVPPSARAGLQMVNTVDASGPARNALDGLDKWRETLCLVLNNRSMEDQKALVTLSRLLSDYGRVEAAHICQMFARSLAFPNIFGGVDDPTASIVLLGADHRNKPNDFHRDTDAILLTEVYEFAISTLSSSATGIPMPHLAVYKLQRAIDLMDAGMKTEAQAYCDAIAGGLRSNTKQSMYYHPLLLGQVEDLSNRLKQVPVHSQSWIQKPTIEKVSGTFFKKMNSFITGEDSDAESRGSAKDASESGPLGNIAGSPSISRNASQSDLYGSYPVMTSVAPTSAGSRYAPNGIMSNRSSSELVQGRQSFESQRSPPSTSHSNEIRSTLYAPMMQQHNAYSPLGTSPSAHEYHPSPEPSMPMVAEEPSIADTVETLKPSMSNAYTNGYSYPQPAFGGYTPYDIPVEPQEQQSQAPLEVSNHEEQAPSTYEPTPAHYGGYAPPEDTGYVPYQPEPDSDKEDAPKPKKKSFLDDDQNDFSRISNASPQPTPSVSSQPDAAEIARRKANDDAANAAFLAAAEADANRGKDKSSGDSNKKPSGSWLGGWFGGGKKPDSLDVDSGSNKGGSGKVYRAKLGESKMKLYYDKEKGRWINPENPDAGEKKTVAPPPRSGSATPGAAGTPPMGSAPPRAVSSPFATATGTMPPPPLPTPSSIPLPASRTGTPAFGGPESDDSRPGTSSGAGLGIAATLPPGTNASLGLSATGPPSRPVSALSSATGLDDLLGGPPTGARKPSGKAGARGGRKGRYVDVMAQ